MKLVIWLLAAVTFLVPDMFCNEILLSKFHQNSFKVKDFRWQSISYDENYFNFFSIKPFKYNRTTTAHNGTLNFKLNVKDKVEILVEPFKFVSNEYRFIPAAFQLNLKKTVDANTIGLADVKSCGNFSNVYFRKDIPYYFCNFVFDETRLPPLIPNAKYRVNITMIYLNVKIALMHLYLEVYTPIEIPKK